MCESHRALGTSREVTRARPRRGGRQITHPTFPLTTSRSRTSQKVGRATRGGRYRKPKVIDVSPEAQEATRKPVEYIEPTIKKAEHRPGSIEEALAADESPVTERLKVLVDRLNGEEGALQTGREGKHERKGWRKRALQQLRDVSGLRLPRGKQGKLNQRQLAETRRMLKERAAELGFEFVLPSFIENAEG